MDSTPKTVLATSWPLGVRNIIRDHMFETYLGRGSYRWQDSPQNVAFGIIWDSPFCAIWHTRSWSVGPAPTAARWLHVGSRKSCNVGCRLVTLLQQPVYSSLLLRPQLWPASASL